MLYLSEKSQIDKFDYVWKKNKYKNFVKNDNYKIEKGRNEGRLN